MSESDFPLGKRSRLTESQLDSLLKAISDPGRRDILCALRRNRGEMTSSELTADFSWAIPSTGRHLSILEDAGLISTYRDGITLKYRLHASLLLSLWSTWFGTFTEDGRDRYEGLLRER